MGSRTISSGNTPVKRGKTPAKEGAAYEGAAKEAPVKI
jgi:hypothetical protein